MKILLVFLTFSLALNASAQIVKPSEDLFALRDRDVREKSGRYKDSKTIERESLENYERFLALDVNHYIYNKQTAAEDTGKPVNLNKARAEVALEWAQNNPVVGLHMTNKYDKDDKGIGFCFGRAMFVHLFLAQAGVHRGSIKKAFVVGSMSGGSWGWHVTTIVQNKVGSKEVWYAIDPVAGVVEDVKNWYKRWMRSSDDGRLKLYIADAGKFGASPSTYTERNKTNQFYNNYFEDMNTWFGENDVRKVLK